MRVFLRITCVFFLPFFNCLFGQTGTIQTGQLAGANVCSADSNLNLVFKKDSCPEYASEFMIRSLDLNGDGNDDVSFVISCQNEHGVYNNYLLLEVLQNTEFAASAILTEPAMLPANLTISSHSDWGGQFGNMLEYKHNYGLPSPKSKTSSHEQIQRTLTTPSW